MNNNNPLAYLMQMMMTGQNPNQIINKMVQQNPQIQQRIQVLTNQIQQSGMIPKDFAMQYFKQNNTNINPLIQMANKRGIKL